MKLLNKSMIMISNHNRLTILKRKYISNKFILELDLIIKLKLLLHQSILKNVKDFVKT